MKINDAPVLGVKPTPGITPEQARDARARAWRFVFDCWEQKKAADKNDGEERARKEQHVLQNRKTL